MRYVVDHDYHMHSFLSSCSADPEQNPQTLLKYAEENGFKKICLTDHFWDSRVPGCSEWYAPQTLEHILQSLPLPRSENVQFAIGGETDMDMLYNLGIADESFDKLDFVIIPTTHLHMDGFTIMPGVTSVDVRAQIWVDRFAALLRKNLPWHKIGIAHITCPLAFPGDRKNHIELIRAIPQICMDRLFAESAEKGLGIELNFDSFAYSDEELDIILRPYKTAKKMGCKFYFGSDAHHPDRLEGAKKNFEHIVDLLELTEDDKFYFGN